MSKARDLFLECLWPELFAPGSEIAFDNLNRAADLWRSEGRYFSAGVAMSRAVHAAWGRPEHMAMALETALRDFHQSSSTNPPDSHEGLASLHKLRSNLGEALWLFDSDREAVRTMIRQLGEEMGQRLMTHYSDSEHADNYLVKGVRLSTDLDGEWTVDYPDYEVPLGTEQFGQHLMLHIPSAFHLFIAHDDWQGAREIIEKHSNAFTGPGLQGWRAAALAYVDSANAVEWFDQAADAFAKDNLPTNEELLARGGSWSGINEQLWAKYFRARARLLEAIRQPDKVKELLEKAAECVKGTESGWHSGQVSRFRILVNTLAKLVSDPSSLNAEQARKEYSFEARLSEDAEYDLFALRFITEATEALRGFTADPVSELTSSRLATAIEALSHIPLIGPEVATAVSPAIGRSALRAVLGPTRTWMHRTLESISDEAKFRKVLLRLLQAGLPLYSQIRHGPVEYGKDIVALVDEDGTLVLRLYQAKCGDIDKQKWRESKDELEEMFLVPVGTLQLPSQPARTEGVLITNGHANPFVEPVMQAWFHEQREKHGRMIDFLHLDRLVDWVSNQRLVNELKLALVEQGIAVAVD